MLSSREVRRTVRAWAWRPGPVGKKERLRFPLPCRRSTQNAVVVSKLNASVSYFVVTVAHSVAALSKLGFFVPAIRPPTVPQGTARLRVSLSALHSQEDIDRLADAISSVIPMEARARV